MKKTQAVKETNVGVMIAMVYVLMFAVNAAVLYVANMQFPNDVVLGTMSMNSTWAIAHSMSKLAIVLTLLMPFATYIEDMLGRLLKPIEWMVGYYVVNFVTLWTITRFSDQFGLGVSSLMTLAVLAFVMNFVQGLVMMQMGKDRTEK